MLWNYSRSTLHCSFTERLTDQVFPIDGFSLMRAYLLS
jgi:hypothetical protein